MNKTIITLRNKRRYKRFARRHAEQVAKFGWCRSSLCARSECADGVAHVRGLAAWQGRCSIHVHIGNCAA